MNDRRAENTLGENESHTHTEREREAVLTFDENDHRNCFSSFHRRRVEFALALSLVNERTSKRRWRKEDITQNDGAVVHFPVSLSLELQSQERRYRH